jgi:hypothetical protein
MRLTAKRCVLTPLAHYDFSMTKAEISKRAAWSWYRTSLLLEQSIKDLENDGDDGQLALGIRWK